MAQVVLRRSPSASACAASVTTPESTRASLSSRIFNRCNALSCGPLPRRRLSSAPLGSRSWDNSDRGHFIINGVTTPNVVLQSKREQMRVGGQYYPRRGVQSPPETLARSSSDIGSGGVRGGPSELHWALLSPLSGPSLPMPDGGLVRDAA